MCLQTLNSGSRGRDLRQIKDAKYVTDVHVGDFDKSYCIKGIEMLQNNKINQMYMHCKKKQQTAYLDFTDNCYFTIL